MEAKKNKKLARACIHYNTYRIKGSAGVGSAILKLCHHQTSMTSFFLQWNTENNILTIFWSFSFHAIMNRDWSWRFVSLFSENHQLMREVVMLDLCFLSDLFKESVDTVHKTGLN